MNFMNFLLNHIVSSSTLVGTSTLCEMRGVNSSTVLEYFTALSVFRPEHQIWSTKHMC